MKKVSLLLSAAVITLVMLTAWGKIDNEVSGGEVTIGNQVWMIKNLNVDKFSNGDPILLAKTDEEWEKAGENGQPAWCYYENDPANGEKYGKLYNWFAVNDTRGLAPAGWHIPGDAEWETLEDVLGTYAGKKMKSKNGWSSYTSGGSTICPNCKKWNAEYRKKVPCHTCKDTRSVPAPKVTHSGNGTNSSGFLGLPGGFRWSEGPYDGIYKHGNWWSSTWDSTHDAWNRRLDCSSGSVDRYDNGKARGLSVRCLRD